MAGNCSMKFETDATWSRLRAHHLNEVAVYKKSDTYLAARNNEFGYANYQIEAVNE